MVGRSRWNRVKSGEPKTRRDRMDLLDERLACLASLQAPNDDLARINSTIKSHAEVMRKDIGGAYAVANKIREASKLFLADLKKQGSAMNSNIIQEYKAIFSGYWEILRNELKLRPEFGSQHDSESGQEVVEAEGVLDFHKVLFDLNLNKQELLAACRELIGNLWYKMGDPDADPGLGQLIEAESAGDQPRTHLMTHRFQPWLAGLADVPGELSKMLTAKLNGSALGENEELNYNERKALIVRFIHITRTIHQFLDSFETCYGQVIDPSPGRRGAWNTFRLGILRRVGGLLNHYEEWLSKMTTEEALRKALR